jgi:hypothetical protein
MAFFVHILIILKKNLLEVLYRESTENASDTLDTDTERT